MVSDVVDLATQKILFSEDGIDAYWSLDGQRVIYSGSPGVTIRECKAVTRITREASPLGDYYSWPCATEKISS